MKLMQTKIGEVCYAGSEDIQRQVANNPSRKNAKILERKIASSIFFLLNSLRDISISKEFHSSNFNLT